MLIRHFPINDVCEIPKFQIYTRSLTANNHKTNRQKLYCKSIEFANANKNVF